MTTAERAITTEPTSDPWAIALHQFLAEEYKRTGSRATAEEYHRWVTLFFAAVGKLPADVTTPEV